MTTELCLQPVGVDQCKLLVNHVVPCTNDPESFAVPLPSDPWSEVVPRLWQGATRRGRQTFDPAEGDFDSVLTLYHGAPHTLAPISERRFHFTDGSQIPANVDEAVEWAYQKWAGQKQHVLVRCHGGLNRSGLVVALLLMKDGHDVDDAIRLIRGRRSPYALCNTFFETYLRNRP